MWERQYRNEKKTRRERYALEKKKIREKKERQGKGERLGTLWTTIQTSLLHTFTNKSIYLSLYNNVVPINYILPIYLCLCIWACEMNRQQKYVYNLKHFTTNSGAIMSRHFCGWFWYVNHLSNCRVVSFSFSMNFDVSKIFRHSVQIQTQKKTLKWRHLPHIL